MVGETYVHETIHGEVIEKWKMGGFGSWEVEKLVLH